MLHAIPEELCSQGYLTLSKFDSSKRLHKGLYHTHSIYWCGEHPHNVTASYRQYLRSYCIHKVAWAWGSLKVQKSHTKCQHWTSPRFWCGEHYYKVTTWSQRSGLPAQAKTIPLQPEGLRGNKGTRFSEKFHDKCLRDMLHNLIRQWVTMCIFKWLAFWQSENWHCQPFNVMITSRRSKAKGA